MGRKAKYRSWVMPCAGDVVVAVDHDGRVIYHLRPRRHHHCRHQIHHKPRSHPPRRHVDESMLSSLSSFDKLSLDVSVPCSLGASPHDFYHDLHHHHRRRRRHLKILIILKNHP